VDEDITTATTTLTAATHAIALTGAGMSVESGIPPFRGAGGLWTKHGEPPMDGYARAMEDLAGYWRNMLSRRESEDEFSRAINAAKPNPGHHALAELERIGVIKHIISQNIDNLHIEAGSVAVTEIHGNRTKVRCIDCGARWPWTEFTVTDIPPACPQCRGIVKSDTVMFGEQIPRAFLAECYAQAEAADVCMIVGTSATVTPAAWFPEIVLDRGGKLIEINVEPTPFTPHCVASIRAPSGEALPQIVAAIKRNLAESSS
jgi:NAD-dependent deacetylase